MKKLSQNLSSLAPWVGTSQPNNANTYLQHFIAEMTGVLDGGVTLDDKVFQVHIENFICDTLAR